MFRCVNINHIYQGLSTCVVAPRGTLIFYSLPVCHVVRILYLFIFHQGRGKNTDYTTMLEYSKLSKEKNIPRRFVTVAIKLSLGNKTRMLKGNKHSTMQCMLVITSRTNSPTP